MHNAVQQARVSLLATSAKETKRREAARAEASLSFKEGYMQKSDPSGKNWKRRYVVCDEARQQLVYYGNDPKRTLVELHLTEEPKGTISLKNAHIEVMDKPVKGAPTKFTFKLITADRVSYLSVKTLEAMAAWKKFIERAVQSNPSTVAKRRWALLARERAKLRYSMTCAPRDFENWILKTDPEGRSWTQRWLVLHVNSGTLSYYEDESKKKAPKGVVNLRGATLDVGSRHVALRNLPAFSVTTPDRTYQFCADSDKNYQSWLNLISAALRAASKMTAKNQADPDFKRPYAGFLRKADPRGKNWKKRWIVLTPATKLVEYFPNETKKVKKGDFSLKSATLQVGMSGIKSPTPYLFAVNTPDRTWYFCAEDVDDLGHWLNHIGVAIAPPVASSAAKAGTAKATSSAGAGAGAGAGAAGAGAGAGAGV